MTERTQYSGDKKPLPYGTWPSEITSDMIVSDSVSIDEPRMTADAIYYIERRPQQSGRCVIVRTELAELVDSDSSEATRSVKTDMIPEPYSVRSRVHEYGGGSYCVAGDIIYFVNDQDQDIYRADRGRIERLTTAPDSRFADMIYDPNLHRLIAVREQHDHDQVINSLVSIDSEDGSVDTLQQGYDFYASPRLNPSADRLCWQSWNHPNMPWDGNALWMATIDHQGLTEQPVHIAGSDRISVFQPRWSDDDTLFYVSDESGWWHLYRQPVTRGTHHADGMAHAEQLTSGEKEFAQPQWVFGQSNYVFVDRDTIICHFQSKGASSLAKLSLKKRPELSDLITPWQEFDAITSNYEQTRAASPVAFIAASGRSFPQLIYGELTIENTEHLTTTCIKQTSELSIDSGNLSPPHTIAFNNRHRQSVYANYYPPINAHYLGADDEKPPLIVICHGGPTGQSGIALDPKKQFWTSRGFALLDVNYSGSTGYGRAYRSRLDSRWGLLDVEDCCDAAGYAVQQGLADKDKLIIRGSSAGGYTVLAALTYHDVFSAGASYYGISELCSLAADTHKFEARYLDRLVGPYPESIERYQQRSPINHSQRLDCPVIFFQGREDKVVPISQAEKMFEALDNKGVTVAAQYFDGEQHGFRKADTITQCLENELSFYQLIFGLKVKNEIEFSGTIELRNS